MRVVTTIFALALLASASHAEAGPIEQSMGLLKKCWNDPSGEEDWSGDLLAGSIKIDPDRKSIYEVSPADRANGLSYRAQFVATAVRKSSSTGKYEDTWSIFTIRVEKGVLGFSIYELGGDLGKKCRYSVVLQPVNRKR